MCMPVSMVTSTLSIILEVSTEETLEVCVSVSHAIKAIVKLKLWYWMLVKVLNHKIISELSFCAVPSFTFSQHFKKGNTTINLILIIQVPVETLTVILKMKYHLKFEVTSRQCARTWSNTGRHFITL